MAAGETYEPIATVTASGISNTQLVMSSIPSTYTDLVMVINGTVSGAANGYLRFNGDTGSNYSYTYFYGSGSSPTSARGANQGPVLFNYIGTTQNTTIVNIMNYANTTTYKHVLSRSADTTTGVMAVSITWRNSTTAINSITVAAGTVDTWNAITSFTLYGIKAA